MTEPVRARERVSIEMTREEAEAYVEAVEKALPALGDGWLVPALRGNVERIRAALATDLSFRTIPRRGKMRERDREFLRRVVAGGSEGINMDMGDTSATKRLTEQGFVRWEQAHPFIARVYATEAGVAADTEEEPDA